MAANTRNDITASYKTPEAPLAPVVFPGPVDVMVSVDKKPSVAVGDDVQWSVRLTNLSIAPHVVHVVIGARFPLREAAEAHRLVESRAGHGKVLLTVG